MNLLSNKSFRTYDYISRYLLFPYYYHQSDGKFIYGTTAQLLEDIGYTIHTVKTGDTFDSIALDYYNNPTMYWVICDFNKVLDPYKKLLPGEKIKVPVLSSLKFMQEK